MSDKKTPPKKPTKQIPSITPPKDDRESPSNPKRPITKRKLTEAEEKLETMPSFKKVATPPVPYAEDEDLDMDDLEACLSFGANEPNTVSTSSMPTTQPTNAPVRSSPSPIVKPSIKTPKPLREVFLEKKELPICEVLGQKPTDEAYYIVEPDVKTNNEQIHFAKDPKPKRGFYQAVNRMFPEHKLTSADYDRALDGVIVSCGDEQYTVREVKSYIDGKSSPKSSTTAPPTPAARDKPSKPTSNPTPKPIDTNNNINKERSNGANLPVGKRVGLAPPPSPNKKQKPDQVEQPNTTTTTTTSTEPKRSKRNGPTDIRTQANKTPESTPPLPAINTPLVSTVTSVPITAPVPTITPPKQIEITKETFALFCKFAGSGRNMFRDRVAAARDIGVSLEHYDYIVANYADLETKYDMKEEVGSNSASFTWTDPEEYWSMIAVTTSKALDIPLDVSMNAIKILDKIVRDISTN